MADKLGLTRGAISKLAERLIATGLATRTTHASDGQALTLALTRKGRSLVPKLAVLADQNDAEFFDHLTAQERICLAMRAHVQFKPAKGPMIRFNWMPMAR